MKDPIKWPYQFLVDAEIEAKYKTKLELQSKIDAFANCITVLVVLIILMS